MEIKEPITVHRAQWLLGNLRLNIGQLLLDFEIATGLEVSEIGLIREDADSDDNINEVLVVVNL